MMTEPTNKWIYFFKRITCLSSWIQYHLWQVIKCLFTLFKTVIAKGAIVRLRSPRRNEVPPNYNLKCVLWQSQPIKKLQIPLSHRESLLWFDLLDTTAVFERLGQEHVVIFLL